MTRRAFAGPKQQPPPKIEFPTNTGLVHFVLLVFPWTRPSASPSGVQTAPPCEQQHHEVRHMQCNAVQCSAGAARTPQTGTRLQPCVPEACVGRYQPLGARRCGSFGPALCFGARL